MLGNHELWEYEPGLANTAERNVDRAIDKYRQLVEPLGMHLVQNELLVYLRNCQWVKFTEDEILDESKRYAIQHAAARSSISIFGGLGFSGLNPKYNATLGIYRNAITSAEDDIRLTERFRTLYNRIVEILGGKRIVVFTHTPYWNWSGDTPVPTWWYVSGHTHHNQYRNDESLSLFADNQIGYHGTELSLKHFIVRKKYDIFEPYGDGIYLIDDNQYVAFNRGLGIDCQFSRGNQVTMLKRSNFYMFLFEANDKLFLLEGGRIRTLDHQDPLYYYERMQTYADIVKAAMGTYMEALKKISKAVKAFGGEGYIHGSIVDIDCFNHVYLNPFDGKISYYYATSIVDKVFYDDAYALLREHAPWLLTGYTTFLLNNLGADHDEVTMPTNAGGQLAEVKKAVRIIDTTMYQPSRIMRSIQYLFDTNVIRVWNEEALQTGALGNAQTEKTIAGSRSTPKPLHS